MLYKYVYIKEHPIHSLNRYLNYFFFKIRGVKSNARFIKEKYIHPDFLLFFRRAKTDNLEIRFKAFFDSYKKLPSDKRDQFNDLVRFGISIEKSFEDTSILCYKAHAKNIKTILGNDSLKHLMEFLYTNTFKSPTLRLKDHYKQLYGTFQKKVCPFCGVELMCETYQEDYDHIAPQSKYPLVAINLKNLAPMCHKCNSKFKKEVDIYYDDKKKRRPYAYPYNTSITIDLDFSGSIIEQTDSSNYSGIWCIKILPEQPLTKTWDEVFHIIERYKTDYIEAKFQDWINDFLESLRICKVRIATKGELVQLFSKFADSFYDDRFNNYNMIKAPLFKFLGNGKLDEFYEGVLMLLKERFAA